MRHIPPRADARRMKAVRRGQWLAARMVCGALAAMLAGATATQAHEIGTTRIVARFAPNDTYAIDVSTDASVLLARLELARKQPRTSPAAAADVQRGFDALCDEVPRHVSVAFDGIAHVPEAICLVDSAGRGSQDQLSSP